MGSVTVPLLDLRVTPLVAEEVASLVTTRPESPRLILNHNLHSAYMHRAHPWFRRLYSQGHLVVIDGWPVLVLASLRSKLSSAHRIGSTDWIGALWDGFERHPMKVFILGATEEVNAMAVERWRRSRHCDLVAGRSGYMEADEERRVVEEIRDFDPHLVLIGMGMPAQEAFLLRHLGRLPAAHIATVGGAVDYMAETVKLSPRWLGRFGLEWLWRFTHDPARLGTRYFVEPLRLGWLIVRDRVRAGAGA